MTPFKAGETYRTRDGREARVYAVDHNESYPIVGAVRDYGDWHLVQWTWAGLTRSDKGVTNSDLIPPTPPAADDLAAARAEIERLAAILTAFPEPQRYEEPADYGRRVDDWWRTNRQAIRALPSPPDANAGVFAALAKEKPDAASS